MFYNILTRITDNDPKGFVGGTQYSLTITKDDEVIEEHNYSTMDLVISSFNPEIIKNKYVELNKMLSVERDKDLSESIKRMKSETLSSKMNVIDDQLIVAIRSVIASNERLVIQYRSGNEKVLNALVGQTMKQYKGDPAVIKQLLIDEVSI